MPEADAAEDELLWALFDVFDADTVQVQQVTVSDLRELAPATHAATVEARRRQLEAFANELVVEYLERFEGDPVSQPELPTALQRLLVQRVAPLQYEGLLFDAHGPASGPPSHPFVPVETLSPLPPRLRAMPMLDDADVARASASVQGELSARLREQLLERGVESVEGGSRTLWTAGRRRLKSRRRRRRGTSLGSVWPPTAVSAPNPHRCSL